MRWQVAARGFHGLALQAIGLSLGGEDDYGKRTSAMRLPDDRHRGWEYQSLALRADTNVVAWGRNGEGQCQRPRFAVGCGVGARPVLFKYCPAK